MANPRDTLGSFANAVTALLADDDLAYANPGEQTLTATLAALMVPHFPGWTVSSEWDRREAEEKRLAWNDEEGKERLRKIRPDIIVHHIGKQEKLLVVEAKRLGRNKKYGDDIKKLVGMTQQEGQFAYEVGVHLILDIPERRVAANNVYNNGEIDLGLTTWLSERLQNK